LVTPDEIAAIELFAGLGEADRERLSRAAADLTLTAGEYAAHEGGERALFVLLEGRIEAVKLIDGIGRVVGERVPGDVFGEVPIALGTVFPVGFRAAERSRVMQIEAADYHAVAAVAPDACNVFENVGWMPRYSLKATLKRWKGDANALLASTPSTCSRSHASSNRAPAGFHNSAWGLCGWAAIAGMRRVSTSRGRAAACGPPSLECRPFATAAACARPPWKKR